MMLRWVGRGEGRNGNRETNRGLYSGPVAKVGQVFREIKEAQFLGFH